jgi:sulfonate transport system permease protein
VLRVLLPAVTIAVLLGGWQLSSLWLNPLLFSTPLDVARAFPGIVTSGTLSAALSQTMNEWAISLGIGMGGGLLLGALMGRYRWLERLMNPFVDFLIATPRVVLVPLLVVWIGVGSEGRILFAVLTNMFVVVINTIAGVRNVNRQYVDVGRSVGMSDRAITLKVRVPGAIPYILAGARLCASVSLVGLIIAELEFSNVGIGYLLQIYQANAETSKVLVLVAVTSVLGLLIVGVFKAIERLAFGWVRATGTQGIQQ